MVKMNHLKYIFLFIIILTLVGIQNLFFAKFDWSIIRDATFWSDTANTAASYYLTIILVVLLKAEGAEANDEYIRENKRFIREFTMTDAKPSFKIFNDEKTLENKANAWRRKVNKKIGKLDAKATLIDREAWRKGDESNRYVVTRRNLLELIDDGYIKENIHYLKVSKRHYEIIQDTTITNNHTPKNDFKFKRENGVWKITKDTGPKFILGTVYAIFLSSFALEFRQFDMEAFYKMSVKIGTLILNGIWAVNYAPKFINEQIIVPLNNAVQHIKEYWIWEKKRKEVTNIETTQLHD